MVCENGNRQLDQQRHEEAVRRKVLLEYRCDDALLGLPSLGEQAQPLVVLVLLRLLEQWQLPTESRVSRFDL